MTVIDLKYLSRIRKNLRSYSPQDFVFIGLILFLAITTHPQWFFTFDVISVGDWGYLPKQTMLDWLSFPQAWIAEDGLGSYNIIGSRYPISLGYGFFASIGWLFGVSERILFMWPTALLPGLGMYYLTRNISSSKIGSFIGSMLYSLNIYALMLGGAHLTIGVAYAIVPLQIALTLKSIRRPSVRSVILAGIVLALVFIYEARIGYILSMVLLILLSVYLVLDRQTEAKKRISTVLGIISMLVLNILIQMYWILPYLLQGASSVGRIHTSLFPAMIDLKYSLALYHPFWTGAQPVPFVVQPLPAYALILPILIFLPLLFAREPKNRHMVLLFSVLAVIGVFLTKQNNEPLGWIYELLFRNFPGGDLFRESSKFYLLVALSYSVLMTMLIDNLVQRFRQRSKSSRNKLVTGGLIGIILLPLAIIAINAKPAFYDEIGYAYSTTWKSVPSEYVAFEEFLDHEKEFFRTFWFPSKDKFGAYSAQHPAIRGYYAFLNDELKTLQPNPKSLYDLPPDQTFQNLLDAISVRYVVVPTDHINEQYSENDTRSFSYPKTQNLFREKDWLKPVPAFKPLDVMYNEGAMDRIYLISAVTDYRNLKLEEFHLMEKINLRYSRSSATEFHVEFTSNGPSVLSFAEKFDHNWKAYVNNEKISSFPLFGIINGFYFEQGGNKEVIIKYEPQNLVYAGSLISIITVVILTFLFVSRDSQKISRKQSES